MMLEIKHPKDTLNISGVFNKLKKFIKISKLTQVCHKVTAHLRVINKTKL